MSKIKEEYHDIICEGQRQAMEDADLDRQYESWLEMGPGPTPSLLDLSDKDKAQKILDNLKRQKTRTLSIMDLVLLKSIANPK